MALITDDAPDVQGDSFVLNSLIGSLSLIVVGSRHSQEKSMLGPYGHCFEGFPSAVVKSAALLTFVCSLEVPRM